MVFLFKNTFHQFICTLIQLFVCILKDDFSCLFTFEFWISAASWHLNCEFHLFVDIWIVKISSLFTFRRWNSVVCSYLRSENQSFVNILIVNFSCHSMIIVELNTQKFLQQKIWYFWIRLSQGSPKMYNLTPLLGCTR